MEFNGDLSISGLSDNETILDFCGDCHVSCDNLATFVEYSEISESGLVDTTTKIGISPQLVTVSRFGDFNSTLVFEVGKQNLALYKTPYGEVDLLISTNDIKLDMNDNKIKLELFYSVTMSGQILNNCIKLKCNKYSL